METPSDATQSSRNPQEEDIPALAAKFATEYEELSRDADMMRVLWVLRQGGLSPYLDEVTTESGRRKAIDRRLVKQSGIVRNHLYLLPAGRLALWEWQDRMAAVLREEPFQALLRSVICW